MRISLATLGLALLAPFASAQCIDPNFGTGLGAGPDIVFAIQPIGFAFPLAGSTFTDIHVSDKGYAFLSNGGTPVPATLGDFTASAAELASATPRICALWSDIQATAANAAQVHVNGTATECTVTWKNVQCYQATSGLFDMQMKLFPSGEIRFSYGVGTTNQSVSTQPTWQAGVVGVSLGQGAVLPAASNFATTGTTTNNTVYEVFTTGGSFDMAMSSFRLIPLNPGWAWVPEAGCATSLNIGTGCGGLTLRTNSAPTLGNATFAWQVTNVPAVSPISLLIFGDTSANPGVDLTFLGMPGCFAYTNANLLSVGLPAVAGASSATLGIPNTPALTGTSWATQAAAFSLTNPANLVTSNGTNVTIGL